MTGCEVQLPYLFWYALTLGDGSIFRFGSDEPVDFELMGIVGVVSYRFYSLQENTTTFFASGVDNVGKESAYYWQKTLPGRVLED